MRRPAAYALIFCLAASPATADVSEGLRAFDAGDYAKAVAEWRPAAARGNTDALLALAGAYRQGLGVGADMGRAIEFYRGAAARGAAVAQANLGEIYALGLGTARDPESAYMWFALAARQGHAWAEAEREALAPTLSAAALGAARARADAWRPIAGAGE